jgi:hypothetical protein
MWYRLVEAAVESQHYAGGGELPRYHSSPPLNYKNKEKGHKEERHGPGRQVERADKKMNNNQPNHRR